MWGRCCNNKVSYKKVDSNFEQSLSQNYALSPTGNVIKSGNYQVDKVVTLSQIQFQHVGKEFLKKFTLNDVHVENGIVSKIFSHWIQSFSYNDLSSINSTLPRYRNLRKHDMIVATRVWLILSPVPITEVDGTEWGKGRWKRRSRYGLSQNPVEDQDVIDSKTYGERFKSKGPLIKM